MIFHICCTTFSSHWNHGLLYLSSHCHIPLSHVPTSAIMLSFCSEIRNTLLKLLHKVSPLTHLALQKLTSLPSPITLEIFFWNHPSPFSKSSQDFRISHHHRDPLIGYPPPKRVSKFKIPYFLNKRLPQKLSFSHNNLHIHFPNKELLNTSRFFIPIPPRSKGEHTTFHFIQDTLFSSPFAPQRKFLCI